MIKFLHVVVQSAFFQMDDVLPETKIIPLFKSIKQAQQDYLNIHDFTHSPIKVLIKSEPPGIKEYIITGTLPNGKRFKPIHTNNYINYNIYKGTIWRKYGNKRIKIKTINN